MCTLYLYLNIVQTDAHSTPFPWYRGFHDTAEKYKSGDGTNPAPPTGCWQYHSSNPDVFLSSFRHFGQNVKITSEKKFEYDKIY